MKKISLVIVTYNRKHLLVEMIKSAILQGLATALSAMFLGFPLTFAQELDARRVGE